MFLLLLIALVLLCLYEYNARIRYEQQLHNIPIVSKIPFVGTLLVMWNIQPDNLHLKFKEYVQRYGKSFRAHIFGHIIVVTCDTRYVDTLLNSHKHIHKHKLYLLLHSWLGNGLLLSNGKKWQTMRKIITPTFHFKILEQFVDVFDRQSLILVQKLQQFADGKTRVDIYPHMGLMALDVIAETAMGVCVNSQLDSKSDFVQAVNDVTYILAKRFTQPILTFPFTFKLLAPELYKKLKHGIATMHQFTDNIIEQRRKARQLTAAAYSEMAAQQDNDACSKPRMALLDVLLQAKNSQGQPLSDAELRDEVNTFMFEGHDTTTSSTSFCLYLLSRHAECQRKLFAEIREHFGEDLSRAITYRDLQDFPYLNCVIKETLRIYPPIPAIGRLLKEDLKLADVTLPAGTNIIIMLWQLLRDPEVFPEPDRFWPERHLTLETGANIFSNIPFSAGPRNCIGQRYALYEMRAVVVQVLRYYELIPLGADLQPSMKIVLRSSNGVNLGLKPRVY